MQPMELDQEAYLKGSFRKGLHVESGVVHSCFIPPTISDKCLKLSPDILRQSAAARELLANYKRATDTKPTYRSTKFEARDSSKEWANYSLVKRTLAKKLEKEPLTVALVCSAHKQLLKNVRGARTNPGQIRQRVSEILDIETLQVAFVPPHPNDLARLMDDLEIFWSIEIPRLPRLVQIAIAQYQFVTIHPFDDGNGRMSRLLSELFIWKYGFTKTPSISLQQYFENNKLEYHAKLNKANKNHDLYNWINFFLDAVAKSCEV